MKPVAVAIIASALLATPAFADWGSGYNMGSIGITGGDEASGSISLDCADGGNPVVPQGSLSIFVKPKVGSAIGQSSPGDLVFSVDGTEVSLPVADNAGDGFVYDKTPETLAGATTLIDLLKGGSELTVTAGGQDIALIALDGAASALDGVEACLAP